MARIVKFFNPDLQEMTDHEASFERNGELVLKCTKTGHFVKIDPKQIDTPEKFEEFAKAYQESNPPRVTAAQEQAEQNAALDAIFGAETAETTGGQYNDAQVPVQG